MTLARRSLIAVVLMTVGLVALLVDSVDKGWTTLGVVGVGCFVVAIAARLAALRRSKPHS
jgi:membrane-bound ClpP family serine protease